MGRREPCHHGIGFQQRSNGKDRLSRRVQKPVESVPRSFVTGMPVLESRDEQACIEAGDGAQGPSLPLRRVSWVPRTISCVSGSDGAMASATKTFPRRTSRTSRGAGSISTRPSRHRISSSIPGRSPASSRTCLGTTRRPEASMEALAAFAMAERLPCRRGRTRETTRLVVSRAEAGHDVYLLVGASSKRVRIQLRSPITYENEGEKMTWAEERASYNRPRGTRPSWISRV